MERISGRKILLTLFGVSFLMRLVFILTLENRFYFPDEHEYFRMVENFLAGRGLIAGEHIKAYRPPLYPLFLSVLYFLRFNLTGVRIVQALISAGTVCLVFLTGKKLFSEKVGAVAAGISVFYPFFIYYTGFLLTETLFIFLVVLSFYFLISMYGSERPRDSAKAGFSIGLAGLCRPVMELYLPVALVHILAGKEDMKKKMKKIFITGLLFAITVSPWVIRNYRIFNSFIPGTTMGGWVFWEGNNPHSDGGPCHYFPEGILEVEETERDRILLRKTVEVIRENPERFLWLLQNKFKRFWNVVPNAAEFSKTLYRVISVMSFGIMLPFFLLGFFLTLKDRKAQFIHSFIIFFTLFHMVFLASIRYRVPLEPFCILFAVYGLFWIIERASCIIKGKG